MHRVFRRKLKQIKSAAVNVCLSASVPAMRGGARGSARGPIWGDKGDSGADKGLQKGALFQADVLRDVTDI